MLEAPKQDWKLYEEKCRTEHLKWLRSLTPAQTMDLYEEFYRIAKSATPAAESQRLEELRRQEKLAMRARLVATFAEMDRNAGGRRHSKDPG